MTRGTLILIEPGRITKSLEFNGDMGVTMDMGQKAIKKMLKISTYSSFLKLVHSFKLEYSYTDPEEVFYPTWDYSLMQLYDMTSEYFDKWASDYLYIKNISGEKVYIKATNSEDTGFELVSLEDGALGILNYGGYNKNVQIPENGFKVANPNDKEIEWAFSWNDSPWHTSTLHRMASVKFREDADETYDYMSEGYDINPGDIVMVRGKGKELKKVIVTSLHWATDENLEKALPGGIKRFKKIEGKAV